MWMTMFKKDIRALSTRWFLTLGVILVIVLAVGGASAFGYAEPGLALVVAGFLTVANLFILPTQLFRSLKSEMRRSPSLWLLTPTSGWSMLWSKLLSSLVGTVLFVAVTYLLSILLLHIGLTRGLSLSHLHIQTQSTPGLDWSRKVGPPNTSSLELAQLQRMHVMIGLVPRFELYAVIALVWFGLYIALWASLAYMSVQAVRYRLKKFRWLVGIGVVLVATWGISALQSSSLYAHLFGWGKFSLLSLLPQSVHATFQGTNLTPPITVGSIVFEAIVMAIVFYLTGRLIHRHVEV